jgi:hypothetical protein
MEHKSEQMMQTALAHGWKAQVKPTIPASALYDEIVWDLYCVRGPETLHVSWTGDRQQEGTYTYGDYTTSPTRRQQVVAILTGKPNPKKLNREETKALLEDRSVPWVHDTPAIEILLSIMNKDIKWIRRFDGQVCEATVQIDKQSKAGMKYFRVIESPPHSNRRVLEWADMFGFHAVGLDQIIDVS